MGFQLIQPSTAGAVEHPPFDLSQIDMIPERGWGVSGQDPLQTQTETLDVLVWDMVQIGDRMFVGGAFHNVQESKRATPIPQRFLAAFDVNTGEWVDTFQPTLDRPVYALEITAEGLLLVGGEFETVNGATRRGLVALDPNTGATDPDFAGAVDRPWSSRRATVRDMKVESDGTIYVAGNFSHLDGAGGSRTRVYKAGKFTNKWGSFDASWKPQVAGGAVWGLDTDPSRSEVALSGFFTSVNGEGSTGNFHVVNDSNGATVPGKTELPRNYPWSQPEVWDVVYGDGIVFAIGEQHIIQVLDSDNHQMLGYHHTGVNNDGFDYTGGFAGGAYQAGERIGDVVIIGCHCTYAANNHYESFTGRRTTRHNVMAYDASTGRHIEAFDADVESPRDGHWAAAADTAGCLWVGGDYHVGGTEAGGSVWLGGFARMCPAAPAINLVNPGDQTSTAGVSVTLQLVMDPQPQGSVTYSADGLPTGLSIDSATGVISGTPTAAGTFPVSVRATSDQGSVSEHQISWVVEPGDPNAQPLILAGSQWSYNDTGADLGDAWRAPSYDDAAWSTGQAEFGFGDGDEQTVWTSGSVTYYARAEFDFNRAVPSSLELDLAADDGAIVYLNGVEILRDNMPAGSVNYRTPAEGWRGGADEEFKTYTVPAAALVQGRNVVAVEVHNVWSGNADLSFDLALRPSDEVVDRQPVQMINAGGSWSHTDAGAGEPADWKQGLQGAAVGNAEFGFGDGDETTVLTAGQITYYFTHEFTFDEDPAVVSELKLGLAADDGAVVYLNGTELHRVNMPDGPVGPDTRPITWVSGSDERMKEYVVDSAALVQGSNVIAVEVHNLWPGNSDLSFDLYLIG